MFTFLNMDQEIKNKKILNADPGTMIRIEKNKVVFPNDRLSGFRAEEAAKWIRIQVGKARTGITVRSKFFSSECLFYIFGLYLIMPFL